MKKNINKLAICLCVLSCAFAFTLRANGMGILYTYEDDFSTDKAKVDSY